MSISDGDASDANADLSWDATDTVATMIDGNEDEEPPEHSSAPSLVPYNELLAAGSNTISSSSHVPASRTDLAPAHLIIAHSDRHIDWFDKYGVPWSAQWQIGVLVSTGRKTWDQITKQDIKALSGTNSMVGPKVLGVLFPDQRQRAPSNRALGTLYVELDREEAALDKGTFETLGLCSQANDTTQLSMGAWWGGRIEQRAVMLSTKWSARFKLGLSASQPVLLFETANIHFIDDTLSKSRDHREGATPAEQVMNDGCGLINRAALKLIQRQKGLPGLPTALQGRIAGAKGLWILDPNDQANRPHIWITKSQKKIHYTDQELEEDPSRRIFDLLRVAKVKESVRLSAQPIINFAHNGVPHTVFSELLKEGLQSSIDQILEDWKSDDAVAMWSMVFNRSGVGNIRKRRYEKFSERIFGNFRDTKETEDHLLTSKGFLSSGDIDNFDTSAPDPNSGWPMERAEQIIVLLQAGFTPSKCRHLASLMKTYLEREVTRITQDCHIPVKRSAEVFAAPDFSGTLKAGEVFFRSSQQCELIDEPAITDDTLRGDIIASRFGIRPSSLIFRNPIKTPSDARRVKAVDYPQLQEFRDVLLFSIHGERSQASILAGGDYDGDTICMIAEPRLVNTFIDSSLKFADPPAGFKKHLETTARSGHEILNKISLLNEAESIRELQMVLLDTVTRENHRCGRYSNMSDIATYIYGYDSAEAHYLSYMYFNELDAAKSGVRVKKDVWKRDSEEFRGLNQPACMGKRRDENLQLQKQEPQRPQNLGPFVLDDLDPFAKEQEERYIDLIEKLGIDADADFDLALLQPFYSADHRASELQRVEGQDGMWRELEGIKTFVESNREAWAKLLRKKWVIRTSNPGSHLARTGSQGSRASDFYSLPKAAQIQKKRVISEAFWNGLTSQLKHFSKEEARRIMCSYAYDHAREIARESAAREEGQKGSFEYAFHVAFKVLAGLKAEGNDAVYWTFVEPFHDLMVPRRNLRNEAQL
ncbi:hypothetical protein FRC01_006159 [Tulasnella sp. 417]|nr:hypothetical protein FRC01_006159 [Tulasnella sp. 417]